MKTSKDLIIPENLMEILSKDEYWEDDQFFPLNIIITLGFEGDRSYTNYQISFEPDDHFEEINNIFRELNQEISGYGWEELIRKYLIQKDPKLEEYTNGDSEWETCVLWTTSEDYFRRLLDYIIALTTNPTLAFKLLY
ncbi:Imm51 family immunity protein [Flexithrix dorotheae]|uniref:Imm51 family immunity protein n=1 Tax=Flexithrix dorotheae TaxID=70993 RepID=UPI00035DEA24|nr:Imm51 family immunity protein [Flexithrix dorotheae]